ncbi:MAG: DNA polymerase I, partial [Sphaerochaetaceae bacterium]|nr:DNA polymerase I [Sphaerochaetaceae bacterium]
RIHTSFVQTGTATGRLSSKNPNLQNIPIRTEEGRRIRGGFVPKKGSYLLSADYSQIELVVLAHLSQDPNLRRAFIEGQDVHKETAAKIFGLFPDMVSPDQRRIAKTINFGIMYGMSAFSLSRDLGISRKDASSFIETYFEEYSKVSSFMDSIRQKAKDDGFVRTAMGHRRFIPEINSSNKTVLGGAERMAVNTVIQGTAAEIMKKAMISIFREINNRGLKSRMLLQVHDEIIIEVPEEELEEMKVLVEKAMTGACELSVPLRIGMEWGHSWGEMH